MNNTVIQDLGELNQNHLWMKREDLIPFSFGGNKARKAQLFFEIIDRDHYDCVVTYGSGSSNHCRVIANMCCQRGIDCYIISPLERSDPTFNSQMMSLFGAEVISGPVASVHDTIEQKIRGLILAGKKPYHILGGGHGDTGTQAYVQCYEEIKQQEQDLGIHFDYVFLASGTGTTQAGLVCGQLLHNDQRQIIGISIARKNPYGRQIIEDSISSYMKTACEPQSIQTAVTFTDDYILDGYGSFNSAITQTIDDALKKYGIPLDTTYTGKAFWGMKEYIAKENLKGKNILFIHTGGTPLFFDYLKARYNNKANEAAE